MPHFQIHSMTIAPARSTENMALQESRGRLGGVDGFAARLPKILSSELGVCLMDPFLYPFVVHDFVVLFSMHLLPRKIYLPLPTTRRSLTSGHVMFPSDHHHLFVEFNTTRFLAISSLAKHRRSSLLGDYRIVKRATMLTHPFPAILVFAKNSLKP